MTSKNDNPLTDAEKVQIATLGKQGDLMAKAIVQLAADRVLAGLLKAPTTPSTQATGTGATAWRVNVDESLAVIDAAEKNVAAQVDVVLHSATQYLVNGQSAIAAVVMKVAADGTASIVFAVGAAATTGQQVAPTNAAIQTAVGAGLSWMKLGETTLNRTGDTTVTQTYDNSKRDVGLKLG